MEEKRNLVVEQALKREMKEKNVLIANLMKKNEEYMAIQKEMKEQILKKDEAIDKLKLNGDRNYRER